MAVTDGSLTDTVLVSVTVLPVNDAPAFTTLGDQTTAALTYTQQTIPNWAFGFDVGPADEDTTQTVQDFLVLVTSGTRLFSVYPTVSNTGTLRYTPNGTSGVADVTVWLQDDGGTANGGIDLSDPVTFTITIPRGTEYSVIASTGAISETVMRCGNSGHQSPLKIAPHAGGVGGCPPIFITRCCGAASVSLL